MPATRASATPLCPATTPGPGPRAGWAAPAGASSACTPTTPGIWRAATTPSAAGSRSDSVGADGPVLAAVECGTNSTRLLVNAGGESTLERLLSLDRVRQA